MNSDVNSPRSTQKNVLQRSFQSFMSLIHAFFLNFEWASLLILAILPGEAFGSPGSYRNFHTLLGIFPFAMGMTLRLWSRGYDKNGSFVLDGPYRYVQNPDELGSLLLYVGAYLMFGVLWSWVLVFAFIVIIYFGCVSSSYEDRLRKKVGGRFPRYRSRVKRWWPSLYPAVNRSQQCFQWQKAFRKEISTWLWLLGLVGVMLFRHRSF